MKTLTRNRRDHCRKGTRKCTETVSKYFDGHGSLYQSEDSKCLWIHGKDGIIVVCSQTFALFWLIKMAVPVKIFQYSFRVPVLQWSLQFLVRVFTFLSMWSNSEILVRQQKLQSQELFNYAIPDLYLLNKVSLFQIKFDTNSFCFFHPFWEINNLPKTEHIFTHQYATHYWTNILQWYSQDKTSFFPWTNKSCILLSCGSSLKLTSHSSYNYNVINR